jgi:hypothetical protein
MELDEMRLTPSQVARKLGVHISSVWRWIMTGVKDRRLGSRLVGGRRYVFERDLAAFLESSNPPALADSPAAITNGKSAVESELDAILGQSTSRQQTFRKA